jgi:Holliday junction DNA helicase RuvA
VFEYIKGTIEHATREIAVIDVGGVGYELTIPLSTYDVLPVRGSTVKLFTHLHVREDVHKLFGFATPDEREAFRQLQTVSGVGPKVALNELSGLSVAEIFRAVQTQDVSRLKSISGIGAKTAQRLIMELKGKFRIAEAVAQVLPERMKGGGGGPVSLRNDAFAAMISLRYTESQVSLALSRVEEAIDPDSPVEEWIKKALQVI